MYDTILKHFWLTYIAKRAEIPEADKEDNLFICHISSPLQRGRTFNYLCSNISQDLYQLYEKVAAAARNLTDKEICSRIEKKNKLLASTSWPKICLILKVLIIFKILTNGFTNRSVTVNKHGQLSQHTVYSLENQGYIFDRAEKFCLRHYFLPGPEVHTAS
jgi:hypothetical protein